MIARRTWSASATVILIWSSVALASVLAAAFSSVQFSGFVEIVISRPISLLAAALFMSAAIAFVTKQRLGQEWQETLRIIPLGLMAGVVVAWIGVWNDGSGTQALSLGDALLFIGTAGALPTTTGPLALLRVAILGLALLTGLRAWRAHMSHARIAILLLAAWVAGAVVLLVQTWVALLVAAPGFIISHSQDALRALSQAHANSYWSNLQIERFFAGVGKQLETGIMLSSAAILFLAVCIALILVARKAQPWSRPGVVVALLKHLTTAGWYFPLSLFGLFAGLVVGFQSTRIAWNGLDVVAFLVLGIAFFAWFTLWSFGRDLEDQPSEGASLAASRDVLLWVFLVGGLLLGWPVFLPFLTVFALGWLASSDAFGWRKSPGGLMVTTGLTVGILVVVGGMFAGRSTLFPSDLIANAAIWAIVAGLVTYAPRASFLPENSRRYAVFALLAIGVAATFVSLTVGT